MTRPSSARLVSLACVLASVGLVAGACSVGTGEGSVTGSLRIDDCHVDLASYDLAPSFFGADLVEDRNSVLGPNHMQTLRIQRGSALQSQSDGLTILVRDINSIARSGLGTPIDLAPADGSTPSVEMTLYANQTCASGFPIDFWTVPGVLEADAGTITFAAVYAPDVDGDAIEYDATFENVHFASRTAPDTRNATLSGWFRFFYQRGQPAQGFP